MAGVKQGPTQTYRQMGDQTPLPLLFRVRGAAPMVAPRVCFAQPGSIHVLFCKSAIDMGTDQFFKSVLNLSVFLFAVLSTLLGQVPFGYDVAEQFRIGTVRYA